MLYGIGCDLCSLSHLEKSLSSAHAAAFVRRVYGPAEQAALGILEAFPARLNAHRVLFRCARSQPSGRRSVPQITASADRPPHGLHCTGCAPGSL